MLWISPPPLVAIRMTPEPLQLRYCPRRYLEEDPSHTAWVEWVMLALDLGSNGNLAALGELTPLALHVYQVALREVSAAERDEMKDQADEAKKEADARARKAGRR